MARADAEETARADLMGILDFFGGGSNQAQTPDPSMAAMRDLGMPQSLIDAYTAENEKNRRLQAMQMIIGGVGNAISGAQGMAPVAAPSIGASGSGGDGSGLGGSMDGLIDRALKFSKLQEGIRAQQQIGQIRQAISSDPRLSDVERKAYLTNPDAYLKLIEGDVTRRTAPDDLDIKYDPDNRVVGAFNKKTQTMLSPEEAAKRGINYATGAPPSKLADSENQLLGNYMASPEVKTYESADPIYRSIVKSATTDTGASDLDMVYGIAKILDPTSVVREGEIQMAGSTGGTVAMFQGLINQINGGAKLAPETRAKLLDMAQNRMGELRGAHDNVVSQLDQIAGRRGLNRDNIVTRRYDPLPDAPVYSQQAGTFIPNEFVSRLKSIDIRENPEAIAEFNARFGQGAAQRVLRIR